MATKNLVGKKYTIQAGTRVSDGTGTIRVRKQPSTITVRYQVPARNGKTRIFWKSQGYIVSALVTL